MLVSKKHNFVFLSAPKCASSSIEVMLRPYCEIILHRDPSFKHISYREYKEYILPFLQTKLDVTKLETICLIREPVSWLNSWYRFRSRYALRNPNHPKHKNSTYGMQFSDFIEAYISLNTPPFASVGSQYGFVNDGEGNVGVDTIFLYDKINAFAEYMSEKIGEKLKLEQTNVSPKNNYKSNAAALLGGPIKNIIIRKLNINAKNIDTKKELNLSENLSNRLRQHILKDFELYDSLKKADI